jgi:diguanylate cyclase (GGDEF)-like protein
VLLSIDLDHFKQINDRYGHAAGDEVLALVGEVLRRTCRNTDIAARLGGEEFAMLVCDTDDGVVVAERLRATIQTELDNHPEQIRFTVSIGISKFSPTDSDVKSAMLRADTALYQAKQRGRDCYVIAE